MTSSSKQTRVLIAGFGVVLLLLVGTLGIALTHIQQSRAILNETVVEHNGCMDLSGKMYRIARERVDLLQQIIGETDPFARDEQIQRFWQLAGEFGGTRATLLKRDLDQDELAILRQQANLAETIVPLQERIIDLLLAGNMAEVETSSTSR